MSGFYYERNQVLDDTGWDIKSSGSSRWWLMGLGLLLILAAVAYPYFQKRGVLGQQKAAVVQVQCRFEGKEEVSEGSGFFINSSGDLLTNLHVVQDAGRKIAKIEVRLNSGTKDVETLPAEVVFPTGRVDLDKLESLSKDWALLKLKDKPRTPLTFLTLVPIETQLDEDTKVQSIGFPRGSAVATNPNGPRVARESGQIVRYPDEKDSVYLIEHNAAYDKGSSGGPLVVEGSTEVVGINTWGLKGDMKTQFYSLPIRSLPQNVLKRFGQ